MYLAYKRSLILIIGGMNELRSIASSLESLCAYYTLCFLSPFRKLSVTPLKPSSIISNNEERWRSFSQQKRNTLSVKLIRASNSKRGDDSAAQGTTDSKVIRAVNSGYQLNRVKKRETKGRQSIQQVGSRWLMFNSNLNKVQTLNKRPNPF